MLTKSSIAIEMLLPLFFPLIMGGKRGKEIYCSLAEVYPRASVSLAYCKVMVSVKWHINGYWF